MLQLAQDHADMLLCKVAGAVTRKGYLYMVFLKVWRSWSEPDKPVH